MATTEMGIAATPSPSDVGRQLRAVRKAKGLSRTEVARSAGLTRRELAAYERGRTAVPESDLWCLAGSCGVDIGELLPPTPRVSVSSDLGALTVGQSVARLRSGGGDGVVREYLATIYELRNLPPGAKPPMREEDLAVLADALGGTPEAIEVRLHELIGASREEAARLRSLILPPRPLANVAAPAPATPAFPPPTPAQPFAPTTTAYPPPTAAPLAPPTAVPPAPDLVLTGALASTPTATTPWYPPPAFDFATPAPTIGDPEATDRFFSTPHPEDPFGPPPPIAAMAFTAPADAAPRFEPPAYEPSAFDPPAYEPSAYDPPTYDASAFDPSAFEPPGVDAPTYDPPSGAPVSEGPWAPPGGETVTPVLDAFDEPTTVDATLRPDGFVADLGDVEIVVLDRGSDEGAHGVDGVDHEPVDIVEGPGDDDPLAILRMPIEGAVIEAPPDPFADAYDVDGVVSMDASEDEAADAPAPASSEEPTDEWFDRAAAAADALISGQQPDTQPHDVAEPPLDGPAPISWSLTAPPHAPTVVAAALAGTAVDAPGASGEFVAAGSDWQIGGIFPATAMADDGTLALRRADVRWALADLTAEGDFTARVTFNFTSGAGFGILFRVSTDDSERITGYSFDVDPIYSGGGFLVRQWNDSRQHWKPLAHAPVADSGRLYGAHVIEVSLRNDTLVARIDDETVLQVPQLSRCSIDAGHEPCRGSRLGVQAWSTTEVTVDRMMVARH